VQQDIDTGLNGYAVGCGDEFPVSDKTDLMRVLDDPLRVGSGQVVAEEENACPKPGGVG
jgi:hypothetical protein